MREKQIYAACGAEIYCHAIRLRAENVQTHSFNENIKKENGDTE
ncbi:hypothetical protein VSQ32_14410 [Lachnospiraceae bacterium KK002]